VATQVPFLGPILTALRRETEGKTSLIGFIGAPWTLVRVWCFYDGWWRAGARSLPDLLLPPSPPISPTSRAGRVLRRGRALQAVPHHQENVPGRPGAGPRLAQVGPALTWDPYMTRPLCRSSLTTPHTPLPCAPRRYTDALCVYASYQVPSSRHGH
jgi:hypothetical protein